MPDHHHSDGTGICPVCASRIAAELRAIADRIEADRGSLVFVQVGAIWEVGGDMWLDLKSLGDGEQFEAALDSLDDDDDEDKATEMSAREVRH